MFPASPASASLPTPAAPAAAASYTLTAASTASLSSTPALLGSSTSVALPSAANAVRKAQPLELFALKVLSLPCPSFRSSPRVDWRCDPLPSAAAPAVCPALQVPASLGPVYAGETFRAAVSIASTAEHTLYDVAVKLELQSGTRRWLLLETAAAESFAVDGLLSFIVSRPLLESGLHCLAAAVSYRLEPTAAPAPAAPAFPSAAAASPSSALLTFSKFFKFNVLQPLSLSCTVHGREGGGAATEAAGCWAELSLTNSTHRQLRIVHAAIDTAEEQPDTGDGAEEASLQTDSQAGQQSSGTAASSSPSPAPSQWRANSIESELGGGLSSGQGARDTETAESPSFSPSASLAPSCSRTFVFRLHPPAFDPAAASSSPSADIGRVSLRWRGAMGELCSLPAAARVLQQQQQQQQRPAASRAGPGLSSSAPAVSVLVLSCPARAALERPFAVRLQVVNRSASALSGCCLLLLRDRMGSLLPMGRSRLSISRLEAGQAAQVQLSLVGIGLGLQRISGLRLVAQHWQMDVDGLQAMEITRAEQDEDEDEQRRGPETLTRSATQLHEQHVQAAA